MENHVSFRGFHLIREDGSRFVPAIRLVRVSDEAMTTAAAGVDSSKQPRGSLSATNGEAIDDGPPSKRRRVALACNACRTRKSRCNGERPKCSLCRNLGFDCQYEPTDSSTNVIVKKEYVSDFEARLKMVEDLLRRHDDLLTGHLSACSTQPEHVSTSPQDDPASNSNEHRDRIQLNASELQDLPAEETVTDGMAMSMSFEDEQGSAFFGPSANNSFTRSIIRAMASHNLTQPKTLNVPESRSVVDGGILNYSRPPSPTSPEMPLGSMSNMYELPPLGEMEQLIRTYFLNTGLLFPFLHEPSFMETYNAFKGSKFSKVRRTWLGLLNVVLAMGSSMDPASKLSAGARAERSGVCYQRALNICASASVRGANLDIVQYLLLASQYLQSTQKSSSTWTLHGLAVKGALALGLHSNQTSHQFSPLEAEIRKRTWYGCILLDRVLSMTFGRPPCIPEDYVRLPLAQPWPSSGGSDLPGNEYQTSSMEFFNASITLHRLIGTTIIKLYGHNLGHDTIPQEAELIPGIFQLEQDLNRWTASLPSGLAMVVATGVPQSRSQHDRIVTRFRTMLTLRYHNLNILIHRQLLCKSLDNLASPSAFASRNDSVSRRTKYSIDACLKSAEETINVVHEILTDPSLGPYVLGAWWFTLFYVFNASLVVFADCLLQRPSPKQRQSSTQHIPQDDDHLSRAIDAFRLLDNQNRVVTRCTEYIGYLQRVLQRWSHPANGQQSDRVGALITDGQQGLDEERAPSITVCPDDFSFGDNLPDLNDFLKDDLELAQFFSSGIFDMQSSFNGMV